MPHRQKPTRDMMRYVRFGAEESSLLRSAKDALVPSLPRIAQLFYERIQEDEDAVSVFRDQDQVMRLQTSLVKWMHRLLEGPHDADYFARTEMIGRMHVQVGLPQRFMMLGMNVLREELSRLLLETTNTKALPALGKILDLELAVMLDAYRESFLDRLKKVEARERADINQTIRDAQQRYESAVELARFLILGLNAQGEIVFANQQAESLLGYAHDELAGTPLEQCMSESSRKAFHEIWLRLQSAAPYDLVTRACEFRARQGKSLLLDCDFTKSDSGLRSEISVFVFARDITDERSKQDRTRRDERLAAVGTLAAGLAHEIRNPLNGARLHLTVIERGLQKIQAEANAPQKMWLESTQVAVRELERLSHLVTEFLDFARPRPLRLQETALQSLVDRSAQIIAPECEEHGILFETHKLPTPLVVSIDEDRMVQVLLNLLRNAMEALVDSKSLRAAGESRMSISLFRTPEEAHIEVTDNGPGIAPDQASLFDAFYSTKSSGTGLGLTLAHRIMADHQGSLSYQSRPGETRFRVSLPLRDQSISKEEHS